MSISKMRQDAEMSVRGIYFSYQRQWQLEEKRYHREHSKYWELSAEKQLIREQ